jgi:hypothetical protein
MLAGNLQTTEHHAFGIVGRPCQRSAIAEINCDKQVEGKLDDLTGSARNATPHRP